MTTLTDYIAAARTKNKGKPPNAAIRERWQTRVVARQLHTQGRDGADAYLMQYGSSIGVAKVIDLALCAEHAHCASVALGFWIAAHRLAGHSATPAEIASLAREPDPGDATPAEHTAQSLAAPTDAAFADLPTHLQPGSLVTQQPVDAAHDRAHYIADPAYGGQPKRDGSRLVITASAQAVAYQTRTMRVRSSPGPIFDVAFRHTASAVGTCVLDGELVFLDAAGMEHRTGAQAAEANDALGKPTDPVICQISVFKALCVDSRDLTSASERERIDAGARCADLAAAVVKDQSTTSRYRIEVVPTAWTRTEKQALVDRQRSEGREGEVWFRANAPYRGGKRTDSAEEIVRTKYLTETVVTVTALTPSTVPGRPFAAIAVAEVDAAGRLTDVGAVGTGFSATDAQEIAAAHAARPGHLRITVRHQGRTEGGKLWHARFDSIAA